MRKKIIAILTIFTMFTAAACEKYTEKNATSIENNILEGKIEVWISNSTKDTVESYIGKFKEENAKVEVTSILIGENEIDNKMQDITSSGKRVPDVMILSEEDAQKIKKYKAQLVDLGEEASRVGENSIRGGDEGIYIDNKVIAIPLNVVPSVMFYRKDIFSEANIDAANIKTWNDYIEAGKRILDYSKGSVKLLPINSTNDISVFNQLLGQLGAGYYDAQGKVLLNTEAALRSMTILKSINDLKLFYDVLKTEDIIEAAKENKIASILTGTDILPLMREGLKDQSGKWGIMNMPTFEPGGAVTSIKEYSYISLGKNAEENKAASKLKDFLYNNKELDELSMVDRGVFPMKSQLYQEAFMDKEDPFLNNEKVWRYLTEMIREAPEYKLKERGSEVSTELLNAQKSILEKNKDIKAALQEIDNKMNKPIN